MSTSDDKSQEVSKQAGKAAASAGPFAEEDPQSSTGGAGGAIVLFFLIGVAVSLFIGWIIFPKLLYSQKRQPIDSNHKLHVGMVDKGCESCHFFRKDGSFSGVPQLAQCIDCHKDIQGDSPDEIRFVRQYVRQGIEIPWLIYAKQPDCVFFSHGAHVLMAKMECTVCHGPVGESEHLRVYEENRITGYSRDIWGKNIAGIKRNSWDRMKMDDCTECHEKEAGIDRSTRTQTSVERVIRNGISIVFPSAAKDKIGSSVQTEKDACFVCHK